MVVYAFVPAKQASERLDNKNSKYLCGEMLYERALKTLLKCENIDKVFLDTEAEEMYKKVDYLPVTFMHRSKSLASNKTDGNKLFLNEITSNSSADIYVQLLCTSPFINPSTIDNAIKTLMESDEFDSALLMKFDKMYMWKDGQPFYDKYNIPNSKDLTDTVSETMGLYIVKKDTALKTNRRIGDCPLLIKAQPVETIDVNCSEDFKFAEIIANGKKNTEINELNMLKNFISSSLLSDLLDDLEDATGICHGGVIQGLVSNISHAKLFGRAKTLHLRKLQHGEDFKGIYKALDSYESVTTNDIIVVQNDLKEFAYFGDLNTRIAQKVGAAGVILNSCTRDSERVKSLGFPVFSTGYSSKDVRRRATVESINKKVVIGSVDVEPNDLIFADSDGIVVIKRDFTQKVIQEALLNVENEINIVTDIFRGSSTASIVERHGAF